MKQLKRWDIYMTCIFLFCYIPVSALFGQNETPRSDYYQLGVEERLLITVHILGEVRKPGEYLVPDNTNLLELISKAGGPTEYGDLSNVRITRGLTSAGVTNIPGASSRWNIKSKQKEVLKINMHKVLNDKDFVRHLPILLPGDVVRIERNTWYTWQSIIRVVSQVAIVIQAMYWYSRIEK